MFLHTAQSQTRLLYGLVGLSSACALLLAFYLILRQNSNLYMIINYEYAIPGYLWFYFGMTLATAVLFGINMALLTYRWRRYGSPFRVQETGTTGIAAVIGIVASACPVCGTTLLSALGVVGGLSVLPFQGLGVKALSLGLMAVPLVLLWRELRQYRRAHSGTHGDTAVSCPVPRDHRVQPHEAGLLLLLVLVTLGITISTQRVIAADPVFSENTAVKQAALKCDD
jgi:hypothetical protein